MKEYYGNYLGLCINNDDPEKRGRVQVFIPHIMPALYQDWNEAGEDIKLLCVGDNLPDSLPSHIVERLIKILPWSEAASPILGTSSPGNLITNAIDAFGNAVGNFFNQSPTATPNKEGNLGNALEPINFGRFSSALQKGGNPVIYPFWDSLKSKYSSIKDYGIWGDASHQQRKSDHNTGDAIDVGINNVNEGTNVFNDIIASGSSGQFAGSVKYAIFNGQIWSPEKGLRPYTGTNPHNGHVHVSFNRGTSTARSSLFDNDKNNPYETTSTSGQAASLLPHQSSNPLGQGNLFGSIANPLASQPVSTSGQASIAQGIAPNLEGTSGSIRGLNQNMSSVFRDQYSRVYLALGNSKFANGTPPPSDGSMYGINTGSREEWANFFTRLASVESSFNSNRASDINGGSSGPITSFGLYQLGAVRFNSNENWRNTNDNTNAFVRYAENLYFGTTYGNRNVIAAPGSTPEGYYGLAAGYGPLRRTLTGSQNENESQLLAQNIASSERQIGGYTGSMVNQTDRNGATPVLNLNNMAKGVFTYPAAGAVLWVFFREGNPLFPVYFAANYGQREWESAFRLGSDAPKYKPAPTPSNPVVSTGGVMNLGGVGAITWDDTTDPTNNKNNQKSLMIGGHDGSNMFFNDGFHQLFSKFDRRDQVEGDRFNTTLGTKEEWVQSDSNSVIMGDQYIKVGNVSPDVVQATRRIQEIMKTIAAPLTRSTVTGQNRRPGSSLNTKFTKEAQIKYQRANIPKGPFKIPAQTVLQNLTDNLLSKFRTQTPQAPQTTNIKEVPITPPTPPPSSSEQ